MSLSLLADRATALGVSLSPDQLAGFAAYREEILSWNARVNLTSVTDAAEIELRHFVDSIACLAALPALLQAGRPPRLIDVGSGAGFPGLPLKLVSPRIRLTLLDSVRKKTVFLEHVVRRLGLVDVTVITDRAETLARSPDHRDGYEAAVSRAVAGLPALLELCLPFVRPGGRLVAPRRGDLLDQQAQADRAARELGGRFLPPIPVDLGPDYSGYGLVIVEKTGSTPERYPRRNGVPARDPIR